MIAFLATVHILVDATSNRDAADVISGMLTEGGIYEPASGIIGWSYGFAGDRYRYPAAVVVPDDYDRENFPLHKLANGDCS